jgi:hypothetical protein
MASPSLSGILRKNGQSLIGKAIDSVVTPGKVAGAPVSLPRRIAGVALTRIALQSVPGAIIVGGVLLAKHLHDAKKAKDEAETA